MSNPTVRFFVIMTLVVGLYQLTDAKTPRPAKFQASSPAPPNNNGTTSTSNSNNSMHLHKNMMHNHLSRKVFDRACAASKDTLDEIIACLTGNEHLATAIKKEDAFDCHMEAFGVEFDPKDMLKHRDLICNNREKFEHMTACVYRKTAENMDHKAIEKLTEAMVDVGLCIINALDS